MHNINYNYKAFTPDEVSSGLHMDLINYLLSYNAKSNEYYYDIHITTDGYCTIVEWTEGSLKDRSLSIGSFEFVDTDQQIMQEVVLPDNSIIYIPKDEDANATISQWIKDNNWSNGLELDDLTDFYNEQ